MKEKLQKALKFTSGINIAHALVLGLVVKAIILDVSLSGMLLSIPILAYEAYRLWLKTQEPKPALIDAEVRKELEQVKSKLAALTMDKNVKPVVTRYY